MFIMKVLHQLAIAETNILSQYDKYEFCATCAGSGIE